MILIFKNLIIGYFENISAAIITFDLTNFDWGRDIQPWIDVCFENNEGNVSFETCTKRRFHHHFSVFDIYRWNQNGLSH